MLLHKETRDIMSLPVKLAVQNDCNFMTQLQLNDIFLVQVRTQYIYIIIEII